MPRSSTARRRATTQPVRILSLDGGGIRGVIPAVVLVEVEKRSGKRIADLFDLIAGTSTGGILAVGLTVPDDTGARPKYTAQDMLDLYRNRGKEIFQRSFWKGITSVAGIADERYDARPLEALLRTYLGNARLSQTVTDVLATAYEIETRQPYFFKTTKAKDSPARDHLLCDVARATSAAPTYFEPAQVPAIDGLTRRALIDGGVFANNPAMCAYAEVISADSAAQVTMLSLGTGDANRKIAYDDARHWGMLEWVRPIISVCFDGVSDAVDYQLQEMLPPIGDVPRYLRLDTPLDLALDDMDAIAAGNIEALAGEGRQIIDQCSDKIDAMIAALDRG